MPQVSWTAPDGQEWKAFFPKDFEGDLYIACYHEKTVYTEARTTCPYVFRIVKDEYIKAKVRNILALAARNIKGQYCVLHVPFAFLVEVVAKAYVFPHLLKWFYEMDGPTLLSFMPLAIAAKHEFAFPTKILDDCLHSMKRVKGKRSWKNKKEKNKKERSEREEEENHA